MTNQAEHLQVILGSANLGAEEALEHLGAVRRGMSCRPLCLKFVRYNELHDMVPLEDKSSTGRHVWSGKHRCHALKYLVDHVIETLEVDKVFRGTVI